MSNFSNALKKLRNNKGITQAELATALGVGKSTISLYEVGRREPDFESLEAIADYFNVPMADLVGSENSQLTKRDRRDIARDLERIMADVSAGGDLQFDGAPMSEEARASIMSAMQLGLEAAKAKNKERFTPKKYKGGR